MPLLADIRDLASRRSRHRSGWVGVDVGSAALKLVEVERRGSSFHLVRSTVLPRPAPVGEPAGEETASAGRTRWIGPALRQHVASANPFAKKTAAGVVSMAATPLRLMEFPPGTPEELQDMAAAEFNDAVETAGRRQVVGCWPAPGSGKEGLVPIYAIAADEEASVRIAEDLWSAGLRMHVLDGLPFALARGVGLAAPEDVHVPVAALDWGYSTATFVIALDGRPAFVRVLRDCGLRGVIESVARGFSLPHDQVQELLVEVGLPHGGTPAAGAAVASTLRELAAASLNRLVDEILRTLDFLAAQNAELAPRRMWLYGGGGMIRSVGPWLAEMTGLAVEPWRLPDSDPNRSSTLPLFGVAASLSALGCEP